MKRFLVATLVTALSFAFAFAGDPAAPRPQSTEGVDTLSKFTITTGLVETGFQIVDSLIDVCSDSGVFVLTAQGYARMSENEYLYLGFCNDSASVVDSATGRVYSNLDTLTIKTPDNMEGYMYIPFFFQETIDITTATTDTFYFNAAVGSGGNVELKDVKFTVDIHD